MLKQEECTRAVDDYSEDDTEDTGRTQVVSTESGHDDSDSDTTAADDDDVATHDDHAAVDESAVDDVTTSTAADVAGVSTVKSYSFPRSISENSSILNTEKVCF